MAERPQFTIEVVEGDEIRVSRDIGRPWLVTRAEALELLLGLRDALYPDQAEEAPKQQPYHPTEQSVPVGDFEVREKPAEPDLEGQVRGLENIVNWLADEVRRVRVDLEVARRVRKRKT